MKQKFHLITMVCVTRGSASDVGSVRTELEMVYGASKPISWMTKRKDGIFGLHKEIMRTEVELDIPDIDADEMREIKMQSLVAERSELEANFFVAKKRIEDEIASLQAIENKE